MTNASPIHTREQQPTFVAPMLAATAEARALPRSKSAPFSVERFNDGVADLARDHVARGVPLPRFPYLGQDLLSQINLGLLARRVGVKSVSPDAIKPETRNALLEAMDVSVSRKAGC